MTSETPNWKVFLSDVSLDERELESTCAVLRSGWLSLGPRVAAFEKSFAELHRVPHAVAVSSGTSALHLALLALGIGPGDEVIQPAINFVAGANMTRAVGATPRFVDIVSADQPVSDMREVEAAINRHTKAIMVLHYGGYPAAIREIVELARQKNLAVIEDACHAPATFVDGCALGGWGDVGCFSFFPNKNMTTAEGGMAVTSRDDLAARIRTLRTHGMTSLTWDRHRGHASSYDVTESGYNYRLDEVRAALGIAQLTKLPQHNQRRAELTAQYRRELASCREVEIVFGNYTGAHAGHLFVILVPENLRHRVVEACRHNGIQTSLHYPCITGFTAYQEACRSCSLPRSEEFARRAITLPLHPKMTDENVKYVCQIVRQAVQQFS